MLIPLRPQRGMGVRCTPRLISIAPRITMAGALRLGVCLFVWLVHHLSDDCPPLEQQEKPD